jgi:hypothetical protein
VHHRFPRPSVFASLVCVALLGCMMQSACTKSQRTDTLRTSLISLNAARDGFTSWDREHQQQIVDQSASRDEALKALETYRDRRKTVADGFEVAYRALALAATQTDDPSLNAALASSRDLVDAVKALIGGK